VELEEFLFFFARKLGNGESHTVEELEQFTNYAIKLLKKINAPDKVD